MTELISPATIAPAEAASIEALPFEDALEELENVVSKLETGRVPLQESLALSRRGAALIERCERELDGAEAVLEQLIATPEGELQVVRIGDDDEDDE